jgi:3-deoxy-D-manno-octulosonic-acid transferase
MGYLIYYISTRFYLAITWLVSPFHAKARRMLEGKKAWREGFPTTSKKVFWMHCASLGEFEQGRPLLEAFKKEHDWFILLTFFSPTGIDHTRSDQLADHITYLPWDSKKNAKDFYAVANPSLVCFVKYEFWYHFLRAGSERNIPVVLVSGIFRPQQLFFKWYGGFFRKLLSYFQLILVQNDESVALLQRWKLPAKRTGDLRIDRVTDVARQAVRIPLLEKITKEKPIFIIGSAWMDDFKILAPVLNDAEFNAFTILAPHEINQAQIQEWKKRLTGNVALFSENKLDDAVDVLILDTIGVLASSYKYGDFAYVGGAFGDGLHNILEPAAFGLPVVFGDKYYDKFQEAIDLLSLGGAVAVGSEQELKKQVMMQLQDSSVRAERSTIVKSYLEKNQGATQLTLDEINKVL